MVRRFSWCTAVALVVLLFVTTEGLRERGAQTDDHKAANRGTLKYNSKSPEEATTASSASSLSRSRTNRDRSVQSRRFSNIEGTTQASTINSESSSSESSIIRTTKRDSTSTATQVTDGSDKKVEEVGKTEPAVNRRNGKRYFPENDEETRSKDNEQRVSVETSRGISRRTSNGRSNSSRITERLDNKGPSVFLATTEPSRSRTGRKIQTTYSKKDLKTQLSTSRRHSNKKFENEFTTTSYRRGRSTTERIERSTRSGRSRVNNEENDSVTRRGPDTLLSESESVRVDIPLVVNGTGNRSTNGSSLISQRRSDTKESSRSGRTGSERSKNRGRSNDAEVAGSSRGSSGSRRGSSKFGDSTTTTEANELVVSSRRNTVSRDRSRSFEQSSGKKNSATESRSRSRGRNLENNVKSSSNDGPERDAKRKVAGERSSSERRSRVLDGVSRVIESRGQDGQDARGRSRNRSRPDVVTPVNTDVTTTVAPETTVLVDVTTIDSEVTTIRPTTPATTSSSKSTSRPSPTSTSTTEASGRGRGRGRGGRKQKEDFFNYGLGFRGRKPSPEGSSNATQPRKTILWKNDTPINGNPGWTLRRRPGNFNNTANPSRTIVPSSRDQTNEVIPPNDESTSTEVAATTTESSTTSSSRRGFKKLQTIDESSTVAGTTAKSYRRGNKTFGNGKATADREESDNYPPEFKARLTQLKNTNTKIPAPKTTSRTQLEEQERRIYGRRSRNNSMAFEPDDLETAASANVLTDESLVVNPLTLINGRGLRRVKKSSAALFAERSRMKLDLARRLVKPELNIEENDLDATTASSFSKPRATGGVPVLDETSKVTEHGKPAATASGGRSNRPSTSVESSREEVNVKSSRKDHEDSSKVTGRPNGLKKGRIIAERMVTSISIEERTAIEETTKPYVLSTNPSATLPAEQGSETVVDSSRIRLSGGRAGKKSKEEDSTIKNMKVSLYSTRRTESSDHVTTVKPKKPYVYQSRNTKFQLQEQSTAIEQRSTTPSPKKPYAPTHRKSQTSQQDDAAKKTKFSNSAGKPIFRPRYSKRAKEKSLDEKKTDDEATITAKVPVPTSRYSRKKSLVNSIDDGSITTERSATQTKKLEFRPRTATYRRHSEVPTTLIESSTKVDRRAGVAITPRSTKYHATLRTTTASPRSVAQEPRMSLKIANESASGIIDSSNGDTGNSNIFNPTRSTFLSGNNTLLEQLRSTVAPLLSSLGNKTPVFSESYSNVNNANSPARITPSGQPPRFSARYKGAELFVRKQNNIYQPTVPSITSSSTTPVTPVENSGSAPPIDISSPGEPRFLTLYQALESASIRNEQLLRNASLQLQEQRSDRVSQVDSNATAIANVIGDNVNNDTTSPTVATVSPQTPDTIANTTQDSTQTPRLSEDPENSTPPVIAAVPETPTTTDSVFTSAEPSSSTEQASTSAESLSSTEQISTSTDSSSTLEQISVRVGSVPVTEPASTESSSQAADETTTNVTDAEDVRNSTTNQELVSSTTDASTTSSVSEASSTELDVTSRVDVSETTTVTNTATTSENPEINTIPLSDVTVTQIADISSTDASTTEMDSNNANNVETTTTTSTSTIRTRLIDFAEDILSRLQATLSTTMLPSQDSTTTLPPAIDTEISNVVSGSNGNRSLESLSQLRDETTTSQGVTTDQSSLGTTEEVTTENAVGSITTSSSTMVPSREVDTQDELNAFTSTTPATTTTATVTQDSQTVSNTDSTIVRDSNDSSSPTLDVEVTTASIVTSTNDTLLTELMSIAKTLLSEEINSSQEATARQNSNVTSRLGDTMGNEIDRPSLSNDVLSTTTQATETSSVLLDVTTESVDSMSTTVVAPKSSTFFVDTPQNESNALLNTQMGTASVTPIVSTGRPPTDSQGGRIVQGRERDEATRTKEAGGQRSSVYIGQDKFVNYWTDGASTSNPRVLGVNINSVATATKEGPSPAVSSFENLLNNQPDRRVTAPPGFPWRDPLDQIFGITTSSPVITASVASNTLDDSSEPNGPISARPINPFVEVFTPFSNAIGVPRANIGSIPPPPPPSTPVASSTTPTPTTTMASPITTTITTTTTTIATTMAPTTITTMAPTISTVTARTTTPEPATTAQRPNIASQVETSRTSTSSQTNSLDLQKNLLNPQQQNAFGTTFDDLVFLNSLLQSNSRTTTQKTLTQVEQLLANKILELALKNPGPTRSPKAINTENPPPNSIYKSSTKSPSEPIIIELSSSSATSTPTWKSVETQQPTSQKPTISSATPVQVTWKPVTTTTTERIETSTVPSSTTIKTTLISTTKASVTVKAKPATTPRPKTTTQAPLGFAGLLWQTLLGGNIFGPSTTPKPAKAKPVPKTTQKAVNITPKPLQTTERTETTTIPSTTTLKTVDISKIQVSSPNSIINEKSVTTPAPISTTGQPLINNPNPRLPNVVTSTYSPEDDAKFLVELLRAVEQDNKIGSSKKKSSGLTRDDEAFLRAILSGRALTTPPAPPSTTEVGNAALLAALLKAQGIEPSTPANNIREQLQLASLGQSVTSTPATSPASESTTITTRPASTAANRPTDTTKKSVTPRPTSGPRTRTTIWSPSSTYPPPLFSSFVPVQSAGNNSGSSALIGATRAFSQFLGAAISGAAQQLQSLVRNGTRIVSEVVG
ncbi:serine-rich adhesin for platelets-like isoform X12 [Frieseomelitta varia]|uniref:serine-rich adhesin for platelets-like isoform X12 n=1 Tax=Frieseomelitta varia TaxID=561572 RepID=UPI001CB68081|nr:serine-rich adhesin for platelets-like isoform X12 [Frieseomelitta varia]